MQKYWKWQQLNIQRVWRRMGVLLCIVLLVQAALPGMLSLAGQDAEKKQPFFVELCTSKGIELVAVDMPDAGQQADGDGTHDDDGTLAAHCPLCLIAADEHAPTVTEPAATAYYILLAASYPPWQSPAIANAPPYLLPDVRGSPSV